MFSSNGIVWFIKLESDNFSRVKKGTWEIKVIIHLIELSLLNMIIIPSFIYFLTQNISGSELQAIS